MGVRDEDQPDIETGAIVLGRDPSDDGWELVGVVARELGAEFDVAVPVLVLDDQEVRDLSSIFAEAADASEILVSREPQRSDEIRELLAGFDARSVAEWEGLGVAVHAAWGRTCKNHPDEPRPCQYGW